MKAIIKRLILLCISLMFVGMSIGQSNAKLILDDAVGIWLFDEGEGNIAKDSSNNGHDGEIRGNAEWVEEEQFGSAISFPGVGGSRVNIPYKDSLNLVTWSITMWAKLEDTGNWQWWFSKEAGFNGPRNFFLLSNPQGIVYTGFHGGKGYVEATSKTEVHDNEWHHFAATYNKKMLRLYIDGTVETQKPVTDTPIAKETDVIFGERLNSDNPVKGIVDELGLFNRGLSEDEVNNIRNNGVDKALNISPVSLKDKLARLCQNLY